jgi:anti-anti-sigma factor
MPVKCEDYDGVCVIGVTGELAGDSAEQAKRAAENTMRERRIVDFIVDLEKAVFIDSAGLETLLWIKRRCEELSGQIKLAGLDETIRKILAITRLDHRFACAADVPTALKTMR